MRQRAPRPRSSRRPTRRCTGPSRRGATASSPIERLVPAARDPVGEMAATIGHAASVLTHGDVVCAGLGRGRLDRSFGITCQEDIMRIAVLGITLLAAAGAGFVQAGEVN